MEIKQIVEKVIQDQKENNATILAIFLIGSSLFFERGTDKDYIVICKNYTQRLTKRVVEQDGVKHDFFIFDEEGAKALLDFNEHNYINNRKIFNYLFDTSLRKPLYGSWNYQWSVLEHKEAYRAYMKDILFNKYDVDELVKRQKLFFLGKDMVHFYLVSQIYKHNKVEVTPEMIETMKVLYERKEPAETIIKEIIEEFRK
jgi:hypothetical protein